jgi:hypothetical protein
MIHRYLTPALLALLIGTAGATPAEKGSAAAERGETLSLVRLIANPGNFDGHRVRLTGYLANNGLDMSLGLFLSETDGRNFIVSNSVDLKAEGSELEKLKGKYVILDATFHAAKGRTSEYLNGFLDDVARVREWRSGDAAN